MMIIGFWALGGCTSISPDKGIFASKKVFNKEFLGKWIVENSSAEFTIKNENGKVTILGWDFEDQEEFNISEITWDSSSIGGTFVMPSTHHRIRVKLIILDVNTLRCQFSGDASGETTWYRKKNE